MPTLTDVGIAYLLYAKGTETFVRSRESFPTAGLRKSSPAADPARQDDLIGTLRRLSDHLG